MRYKFIDEAKIFVRSGDGGSGCISFRREKYVPFGGPDGGNGGRGGDVIIVADAQLATLLDYRFRPRHIAGNGIPGMGKSCSGRDGEPVILRVPVGTEIYNLETDELLADLNEPNAQFLVAEGGRGGKGNEHFKTSTRQVPKFAQPGEPGTELNIRLELKLLADVGLVGFPNVGKSSLIARISAAKPKIADYPFTTLVPNLGVVRFGDGGTGNFVVADVPGLIVGAHQGAGLGTRFLRHVERVQFIVHLVTVNPEEENRDPITDFTAIEEEIRLHNDTLATVPRILVLNRNDLDFVSEHKDRVELFAKQHDIPFFAVSAVTGQGVQALVNFLGEAIVRSKMHLAPVELK